MQSRVDFGVLQVILVLTIVTLCSWHSRQCCDPSQTRSSSILVESFSLANDRNYYISSRGNLQHRVVPAAMGNTRKDSSPIHSHNDQKYRFRSSFVFPRLDLSSGQINEHDKSLGSIESGIIVESLRYLNSPSSQSMLQKLVLLNQDFKKEFDRANFWSGGSFAIINCTASRLGWTNLHITARCSKDSKIFDRDIVVDYPFAVEDPSSLKMALIHLAVSVDKVLETANIAHLPFGDKWDLPLDFRFNDVPHATWVRSYINDIALTAVMDAIDDDSIPNRSRMQLKINIPEINPAFDTYRIGTLLELIRYVTLALVNERGKRVRICVQQSLGEGVFAGLPLAIAAVRAILERMDWGSSLTVDQLPPRPGKGLGSAAVVEKSGTKPEDPFARSPSDESSQLVRLGAIGKGEIKADDDVVMIIAPQNMIGASVMELLEDMIGEANGRPVILVNPILGDRPSSNNVMQIRGRSDRRSLADSFVDIFQLRLLYPSSGGYMYPIRGMVAKRSYRSPWLLLDRKVADTGTEMYEILAALPAQPAPDASFISQLFLEN